MAKFTLEIETDNAAFDVENGGLPFELRECLRRAIKNIEDGRYSYTIFDTNGNRVGGHCYG